VGFRKHVLDVVVSELGQGRPHPVSLAWACEAAAGCTSARGWAGSRCCKRCALRVRKFLSSLITALGGRRVADEARRRGASGYLEKPFRVLDLVTMLRSFSTS